MVGLVKTLVILFILFSSFSATGKTNEISKGQPIAQEQQSIIFPFKIDGQAIITRGVKDTLYTGIKIEPDTLFSDSGGGIENSEKITLKSLGDISDNFLKVVFERFGFRYEGETLVCEVQIPVKVTHAKGGINGKSIYKLLLLAKTGEPYGSFLVDFNTSELVIIKHSSSSMGELLLDLIEPVEAKSIAKIEDGNLAMQCVFDSTAGRYICKKPEV